MNIKNYNIKKNIFCHIKYTTIIYLVFCVTSCNQTKTEKAHANEVSKPKIISDSTNALTGKIENLEVEYTVFGCACPNWIRTSDLKSNNKDKVRKLYFYIDPADKTLELPIYFDAFRHVLKIKGQFYQKKDYPKGTIAMEEPLPKAKVFRYTELDVFDKPTFKPDTKVETLILNYNTISCSCAQWSDSRFDKKENPDKKDYYWLEPANEKLINADHIFNGENLPIQIKVTGQIVNKNGFPKRKNLSKVSEDEAGKVFRYTKIDILKS